MCPRMKQGKKGENKGREHLSWWFSAVQISHKDPQMIMWYRCITYFQREAKLLLENFFLVVWRTQMECDCSSWNHVDTLCQSLLFLTFVCIAQIISQRIDCTVDQQRLEEWLFAENPKQGSFRLLFEQKLDYYRGPPKISQTLVLGSLWETVDQQEN